MALLLTTPTVYGIDATYHHIADVLWDKSSPNRVPVRVDSYPSKAERDLGSRPINTERYNLEGDGSLDLSLPTLYTKLKALEAFEGAVDA